MTSATEWHELCCGTRGRDMASCPKKRWRHAWGRSRHFLPGYPLQERLASVHRKKHVSSSRQPGITRTVGALLHWVRAETFTRYAHRPSKKVKYLRQCATVTAFGHPVYDDLIANIAIIHSIFRRATGDRLSEECVNSMFEEWPAIDVANRYFTPKAVARSEDIRPIGIDIDPFGSLSKAASSSFVHTEENKVYYFQRKESANGDTAWVNAYILHLEQPDIPTNRFQAITPQLIQNGDIVEVQVSFIAVPIRDNKYRISTVLRSISLLDGQFSQVRHAQTELTPRSWAKSR